MSKQTYSLDLCLQARPPHCTEKDLVAYWKTIDLSVGRNRGNPSLSRSAYQIFRSDPQMRAVVQARHQNAEGRVPRPSMNQLLRAVWDELDNSSRKRGFTKLPI